MSPRPPNPRRKPLLFGLIVVAVLVITAIVVRGRHQPLMLIGVVDSNDIVVTPRVQGRLDSVLVEEGTEVVAGQLVASIESTELAAQAASSAASTAGAESQLGTSRATELQLSQSTAASLHAAEARVASAQATLARERSQLAQDSTDLARARTMARAGAVATTDVERAATIFQSQQSVVSARAQEVSATQAELAYAQTGVHAVAAARSATATTVARVRGARADSLAAMTRLAYAELRSPVAGVVQVIAARRGELVGPGSPVLVIIDPDHLWVRVAAPEIDAGGVAVGDSVDVITPSGTVLRGRVISKSAEGEFATQRDVSMTKRDIRAIAFRVALLNPRRMLVPGMTVQVRLPVTP